MRAREALIAWTPAAFKGESTACQIKIGRLIDETQHDWTDPFMNTGGAAHVWRRSLKGDEAVKMVFIDFQTIVVGDGIDPQTAHQAFLVIDEYAEAIAADLPGARGR